MTLPARYLLGRAGEVSIAIPAEKMLHIWPEGTETPEGLDDKDALDLRALLGQTTEREGVTVAFKSEAVTKLLVLDAIGTFVSLTEDEFAALPGAFSFALQFFDAACRRAFDGAYPLRLRLSLQSDGN